MEDLYVKEDLRLLIPLMDVLLEEYFEPFFFSVRKFNFKIDKHRNRRLTSLNHFVISLYLLKIEVVTCCWLLLTVRVTRISYSTWGTQWKTDTFSNIGLSTILVDFTLIVNVWS